MTPVFFKMSTFERQLSRGIIPGGGVCRNVGDRQDTSVTASCRNLPGHAVYLRHLPTVHQSPHGRQPSITMPVYLLYSVCKLTLGGVGLPAPAPAVKYGAPYGFYLSHPPQEGTWEGNWQTARGNKEMNNRMIEKIERSLQDQRPPEAITQSVYYA